MHGSDEKRLLLAKAEDTVQIAYDRSIPKFCGFLTPAEVSVIISGGFADKGMFYGGYEQAERKIFGVIPDYIPDAFNAFPIDIIEITWRVGYTLTHRDILGALMSAGIERRTTGDIITDSGVAYVFVLSEITNFLLSQINKIRNVGVKLRVLKISEIPKVLSSPITQSAAVTVPSLRLDAVISGLAGFGRAKSEEIIKNGFVFVNSVSENKSAKRLKNGDVISVRKTGKFKITDCGSISKKGRIIIKFEKYV